jgi:hypothetical protein
LQRGKCGNIFIFYSIPEKEKLIIKFMEKCKRMKNRKILIKMKEKHKKFRKENRAFV